jgi:hypothetical protein
MRHAPTGCGPCSLPYQDSPSLSTGWMQKWSKRKDSHLRSPRGRRVYSALQLLLCHASKKWGSSGIRTRDLLLMRELRCLLRHRAEWWAASVMLRVLPGKNRRLHY